MAQHERARQIQLEVCAQFRIGFEHLIERTDGRAATRLVSSVPVGTAVLLKLYDDLGLKWRHLKRENTFLLEFGLKDLGGLPAVEELRARSRASSSIPNPPELLPFSAARAIVHPAAIPSQKGLRWLQEGLQESPGRTTVLRQFLPAAVALEIQMNTVRIVLNYCTT
jgi:hypothetical protein